MNKTLFSFVFTLPFVCASAIVQAALPISSLQTTDFSSVVASPPFGDIEPPNNVIDDLTYEEWRYNTDTASPGIMSSNSPTDEDIATTTLSIYTGDGSEFRAISIDYSTYGPNDPYSLALYGYRADTQVPGAFISRPGILTGASETLSLNWDNIDEIRVVVNSDYIVFDNVTAGPATSTPTPTPTPPAVATPVPTMSAYGIGLTKLGLLLVAGRRLRVLAKRK